MDGRMFTIASDLQDMIEDDTIIAKYNKLSIEDIKQRLSDLTVYSSNLLDTFNEASDPVIRTYCTEYLYKSNLEIIFITIYVFADILKVMSKYQ